MHSVDLPTRCNKRNLFFRGRTNLFQPHWSRGNSVTFIRRAIFTRLKANMQLSHLIYNFMSKLRNEYSSAVVSSYIPVSLPESPVISVSKCSSISKLLSFRLCLQAGLDVSRMVWCVIKGWWLFQLVPVLWCIHSLVKEKKKTSAPPPPMLGVLLSDMKLKFVRYFQGIEIYHWNNKKPIEVEVVTVPFLAGTLFCSFSDFTLWYLKKLTEHDAIIGRIHDCDPSHTPAEAFVYKLQRETLSTVCCVCPIMPQMFHFCIFLFIFHLFFEAHADTKRQQFRRKSFSLLLKSVKITAVNELNTNGVKSITVQFSKITFNSIVQLKM